jgi:hypothetical protein
VGIEISTSAPHFKKVDTPIRERREPDSKRTVESFEQEAKHREPITVTDLGMQMRVRRAESLKAESPSSATLQFGSNVTVDRCDPAKQCGRRNWTDWGMQIVESAKHKENGDAKISDSFEPCSKVAETRRLQPRKAWADRHSRDLGSEIDHSEDGSEKAFSAIVLRQESLSKATTKTQFQRLKQRGWSSVIDRGRQSHDSGEVIEKRRSCARWTRKTGVSGVGRLEMDGLKRRPSTAIT